MDPETTSQNADQNADVVGVELDTLRRNTRLNLNARRLLMVFALVTSSLAVLYVILRADATVQALRQPRGGSERIWAQLLALTAPVLLLALFAGLAAVAVAVIHSRGVDESGRTVDSVTRLRREGAVAVSARGLVVAFDDQLATAKRAHMLLLWLGRTLFIVTLGLFAVSAIDAALHGVNLLTATLGAASLGAALLGVATKVPTNVAHDVANIVQLQLIATGAHRQISLLESVLNRTMTSDANVNDLVLDVQRRMQGVITVAVEQIEGYADVPQQSPKGNVTPLPPLQAVA
jgi:hypothetical protein